VGDEKGKKNNEKVYAYASDSLKESQVRTMAF
jgi:hypothetical protein